jgi:hypothetical protein
MNLDEQRQRAAAASGCWLMAGAAYLILEAVAAAAYWPDYSYAHNYISDLGRPARQPAGATIGSGFASAMNAAFSLQGILGTACRCRRTRLGSCRRRGHGDRRGQRGRSGGLSVRSQRRGCALIPRRLTRAWCPRPGQLPDAGCSDDDRVVYRAHRGVGTDERVYDHRLADAVGGRPAQVAIRRKRSPPSPLRVLRPSVAWERTADSSRDQLSHRDAMPHRRALSGGKLRGGSFREVPDQLCRGRLSIGRGYLLAGSSHRGRVVLV